MRWVRGLYKLFLVAAGLVGFAAWYLSPHLHAQHLESSPNSIDPILRHVPLEAERVGPTNPAKLPPLPLEKNRVSYLVYNNVERNAPIVYLKIPSEYTKRDPAKPVHVWGVNLLVWYPRMTGAFNPENHKYAGCTGDCDGQMLLGIENRMGSATTSAQRNVDILHKKVESMKDSSEPNVKYILLKSDHFDEIYEAHYPKSPHLRPEKYFIKYGANSEVQFFARCGPTSPFPMCQTVFDLPKYKGAYVHYGFAMSRLNEWQAIRNAVSDLVESFVVTTFRQPEN